MEDSVANTSRQVSIEHITCNYADSLQECSMTDHCQLTCQSAIGIKCFCKHKCKKRIIIHDSINIYIYICMQSLKYVTMVILYLKMAQSLEREGLKYVTTTYGAVCVEMVLISLMLMLLVKPYQVLSL